MYAKHIIGIIFSLFALTTSAIPASCCYLEPKLKKTISKKNVANKAKFNQSSPTRRRQAVYAKATPARDYTGQGLRRAGASSVAKAMADRSADGRSAPRKAAPQIKVATTIIKKKQPVTLQALDAMRSAIDMIDADIRGNQRNHALLLHGFREQVQNNVKKDKHIAKLQKKLNSFQKKVAKLSKQFDFISYNVEVIGEELIRHKKKYEPGNDLSALQSLKRLERK